VAIVYHRGEEYTTLEIIGDPVNVEIGEYVAGVLETELENLWKQAQKTARLKGATAKNSLTSSAKYCPSSGNWEKRWGVCSISIPLSLDARKRWGGYSASSKGTNVK